MLDQFFADAALKPQLFRWNGPLARADLDAWLAARGLVAPEDLRFLWAATGGGELFETEEVWSPLAPPQYGDDFEGVNAWYREQGMDARHLLFSTGRFDAAVRQPDGALVELVGRTHAEGRTFRSLDEWYRLLREEFGERYGLPGVVGPSS